MKFSDLIPIITSFIAILSSIFVARITTKSEFKKLLSQQTHELEVNEIQAFAKMNNAVNSYITTPTTKYRRDALAAIGEFTPHASEKLLMICNSLESAINSNQHSSAYDFILRLREERSSEQKAKKNKKQRL